MNNKECSYCNSYCRQIYKLDKLIAEQAIEIQKLNTENELLKSELNWESECKFAYKSKRDELKLDFDKLCIRYNEVHNYNREKRTLLKEAYQIIECLYNLDTLDSEIDKSWIDEAFRNASMFLQNNTEYKAVWRMKVTKYLTKYKVSD